MLVGHRSAAVLTVKFFIIAQHCRKTCVSCRLLGLLLAHASEIRDRHVLRAVAHDQLCPGVFHIIGTLDDAILFHVIGIPVFHRYLKAQLRKRLLCEGKLLARHLFNRRGERDVRALSCDLARSQTLGKDLSVASRILCRDFGKLHMYLEIRLQPGAGVFHKITGYIRDLHAWAFADIDLHVTFFGYPFSRFR